MLSIVKILDVKGDPEVKLDLPALKIGDPVALKFSVERKNGGRMEVLEVNGRFRVKEVGIDAQRAPQRQLLSVEAADKPPTWRSVKKRSSVSRRLCPARFPRTPI